MEFKNFYFKIILSHEIKENRQIPSGVGNICGMCAVIFANLNFISSDFVQLSPTFTCSNCQSTEQVHKSNSLYVRPSVVQHC